MTPTGWSPATAKGRNVPMMKRLTGLLLACMLILGCALAEEHDAIRRACSIC